MNGSIPFSEIDPRPVEWAWKEHIPAGMITALGGAPSRGKSLVSFHIAADVSREGKHVLVSNHEDRLREIARPRMGAAGADLSKVHTFTPQLVALPDGFDHLREEVERYDAKLVILDPWISHIARAAGDPSIVRQSLFDLDRLCEETGLAALIVAHTIKYASPNSDPLKTIGGANSGLVGMCRAVYLSGRNPKDADQFVVANAKPLGPPPPSLSFELDVAGEDVEGEVEAGFLIHRGECKVTARDLVRAQYRDQDEKPRATKAERAAEWLSRFLWEATRPMKPSEVVPFAQMETPPITSRQLRRAAADIGAISQDKGGQGSTWELTADMREMLDAEYGGDR